MLGFGVPSICKTIANFLACFTTVDLEADATKVGLEKDSKWCILRKERTYPDLIFLINFSEHEYDCINR